MEYCGTCLRKLNVNGISKRFFHIFILNTAFSLLVTEVVCVTISSTTLLKRRDLIAGLSPPPVGNDLIFTTATVSTTPTPILINPTNPPLAGTGRPWRQEVVCRTPIEKVRDRGTFRIGHSPTSLLQLANCTVIEGNLEIVFMSNQNSNANYTDIVLPNLYEITGYLLLFRVSGLETIGQLFPNLRAIKAVNFFYEFSMVVYEMEELNSLSMPNLGYIGRPLVAMFNPQLCFLDKVDWSKIVPKSDPLKNYGNQMAKACSLIEDCTSCESGRCWDTNACQPDCPHCIVNTGLPTQYNKGCVQSKECCHKECLAGCVAPNSDTDCYVCRNVFHNGKCYEKCPEYDSKGEKLFEFEGRRCITERECLLMDKLYKFHEGKCVYNCPPLWVDHEEISREENRYNPAVHICIKCDGVCDKTCPGKTLETMDSIKQFDRCTIIQGYLEIAMDQTADIDMKLLEENLGLIHTVTNYVKVVRTHRLTHLSFLKSLRVIEGRKLDRNKYAFYAMDNENLQAIWDFSIHPNLTLLNGSLFFQQNPQLCRQDIEKLLATTTFNGTFHDLETKAMKNISKATHTIYDVSDTNNGYRGNCFNNSLFINVTLDKTLGILVNFSAFQGDPRIVLSYLIYYRIVGDNETVSYYNARELRQSDAVGWRTHEVENLPSFLNTSKQFHEEILFNVIEPFTRYAFYVQVVTTQAVGQHGERSQIKYIMTYPEEPDPPKITKVEAVKIVDENRTNIGLTVQWEPPTYPKGIIAMYRISYKALPWKNDRIRRKNFCLKDPLPFEETTTEAPKREILNTTQPTCACNTPTKKNTREEEESNTIFRYKFENYLQNRIIVKNPSKPPSDAKRTKRGVTQDALDQLSPTTITEMMSSYTTTITAPYTTSTAKATRKESAPSESGASVVEVDHLARTVTFYDLEPFTEYSVDIVACHAYDKTFNRTRCSKREISKGITSVDQSLDVVDSSTFNITKEQNNSATVALNFSWTPPKKTNGPILAYIIKYTKVDPTAHTNAEATQELCIHPLDFTQQNNTFYWQFGSILAGGSSFHFSLRMKTFGTLRGGNWTELKEVLIDIPELKTKDFTLISVLVSITVVLVLLLAGAAFFCVYRKKKPPVPLGPAFTSINPDYIDTDNVYIPDEWELDKSKIKIGAALGQGSFGMVYEGLVYGLYKTDGKERRVAIKTVNNTASLQERINFLNEASRMKSFDCHHIVKLLGVVSQKSPVLVIMELMSQGDLRNYLRKHRPDEPDNDGRKPPTLKEILQMAAEIADGMAYLAHKKFVHRDLAARNCMVSEDLTVKIGDFGMSRDVYYSEYYRKGGKGMLPVRWMAPESLRDGVCTTKSDVWSYGIVLYEMATLAAQPYVGFTNEQVIPYVLEGNTMEMPSGCPAKLAKLMMWCWQYYPKSRPTFTQILDVLQGDVRKSFFTNSWYYTQKDSDTRSQESNGSADQEDQTDESQPLNARSLHVSAQDLESALDHDSSENMPGLFPYRKPVTPVGVFNSCAAEQILNGHYDSNEDSSTDDNNEHSPPVRNNITESLVLNNARPPDYRAVVDQSGSDLNWLGGCIPNSNGQVPFGVQMTTAC